MIRLSIQGFVTAPGFYSVPSETLVGDALMIAGGPTADADLRDLQLLRAGEVLWEGEELQSVITDGRTLDQMSIQAGDQLYLPTKGESFFRSAGGVLVGIATSLTIALVARR